jgi:hypothetical protein
MNRNESLLLSVIDESKDPTTSNLVKKTGLARATTLKYLAKLLNAGLVEYRMVGSAKVWSICQLKHEPWDLSRLKLRMSEVIERFESLTGSKASITVESKCLAITATLKTNDEMGADNVSGGGMVVTDDAANSWEKDYEIQHA